jgi:hypothetical protein
MVKGVVERREC